MNRRSLFVALFATLVPLTAFAAASNDSKTYKGHKIDDVYDAAREAVTANGWKIKDESKSNGLIIAKTKWSAMSLGSTVSVSLKEAKGGGVKVMASASTEMSSSGKVDKDIERFFAKLDKKLDND